MLSLFDLLEFRPPHRRRSDDAGDPRSRFRARRTRPRHPPLAHGRRPEDVREGKVQVLVAAQLLPAAGRDHARFARLLPVLLAGRARARPRAAAHVSDDRFRRTARRAVRRPAPRPHADRRLHRQARSAWRKSGMHPFARVRAARSSSASASARTRPRRICSARRIVSRGSPTTRASKGIKLGVESRHCFEEIPNEREMLEVLDEFDVPHVGYWHDFGHVQVKHNLGFLDHVEWMSEVAPRLIGCHLHDTQVAGPRSHGAVHGRRGVRATASRFCRRTRSSFSR